MRMLESIPEPDVRKHAHTHTALAHLVSILSATAKHCNASQVLTSFVTIHELHQCVLKFVRVAQRAILASSERLIRVGAPTASFWPQKAHRGYIQVILGSMIKNGPPKRATL